MAALRKTTHVFAHHGIPLECDIYDASDYSNIGPVFLFFHPCGLVGGARTFIPPWLVQTCYREKWPLLSASYRLLPQARGQGLLEDVTAAYEFAKRLGNGPKREVIVGGASAGAFMAALVAHHLDPPLAFVCISGIPTFRHPFFNSSIQLTPEPVPRAHVERFLDGPMVVGFAPEYDKWSFVPDMLLPSSATKNPSYIRPRPPAEESAAEKEPSTRRILFEYFVYKNLYPGMIGDVDPGFDSLGNESEKWDNWPRTIIILGENDVDVDKDVSLYTANQLGGKAKVFMAKGQPHMFEATNFIEDESAAMDVVREAIDELKNAVSQLLVAKAN